MAGVKKFTRPSPSSASNYKASVISPLDAAIRQGKPARISDGVSASLHRPARIPGADGLVTLRRRSSG